MSLVKDNNLYEIDFEEYQKIYKEDTMFSMNLGSNPLNFGSKKEYNAGMGYLYKKLFFAYRSLLEPMMKESPQKAKEDLIELTKQYWDEYKTMREFLIS